jgi:hypothetical protein
MTQELKLGCNDNQYWKVVKEKGEEFLEEISFTISNEYH